MSPDRNMTHIVRHFADSSKQNYWPNPSHRKVDNRKYVFPQMAE
jgi:hypothetical protein